MSKLCRAVFEYPLPGLLPIHILLTAVRAEYGGSRKRRGMADNWWIKCLSPTVTLPNSPQTRHFQKLSLDSTEVIRISKHLVCKASLTLHLQFLRYPGSCIFLMHAGSCSLFCSSFHLLCWFSCSCTVGPQKHCWFLDILVLITTTASILSVSLQEINKIFWWDVRLSETLRTNCVNTY